VRSVFLELLPRGLKYRTLRENLMSGLNVLLCCSRILRTRKYRTLRENLRAIRWFIICILVVLSKTKYRTLRENLSSNWLCMISLL
jgi:hypothetical protein